MGTSVDPAYIERLQEDIIIACRRLEDNGHESLVVTVSKDGHLVFGSEKGKLFLEDRHAFITAFIQCCQNKEQIVKVERDPVDVIATAEQKEQKKLNKHQTKTVNRDEADKNGSLDTPESPENTESSMFDDDTDDYEEMEVFDPSLLANLEAESDGNIDDGVNPDDAVKAEKNNEPDVKQEILHSDIKDVTSSVKSMPEARVVVRKMKDIVNRSKKTGLRSRKLVPKTSKRSENSKKKIKGTPACDICGKKLFSWNGVKRHKIATHQSERQHVCDVCGAKFKLRESLKKHEVIHGEAIHKCEVCGKAFAILSYLTKHMFTHSDEKPFGCDECEKTFINKRNLTQHKLIHTGVKPFKCEGCGQEFVDTYVFKKHLKTHKLEELVCDICGKQCNCKSKLERHMGAHKEKNKKTKKVYTCEVCGKPNSCAANLQKHMCVHTNQKPFVCEKCGKSFSSKQHLQNHMRLHTGEKPYKCSYEGCDMSFRTYESHRKHLCYHSADYPFICDYCGQKFKEKSCMRHHRKKHLIEFRWPCEYCSEKFRTLVRYKTHIVRFHVDMRNEVAARTNIKFWPCTTCPKVFGQKEDYEQHMNVHLGLKPYQCKMCDKAFSSKSNLLQHVKGHTGFNKLRCSFCSKTYSDPKVLKEHLKTRHDHHADSDTEVKKEAPEKTSKQKTKAAAANAQADQKKTSPVEQSSSLMTPKNPSNSFINPMFSNNVSGFEPLKIDTHFFDH